MSKEQAIEFAYTYIEANNDQIAIRNGPEEKAYAKSVGRDNSDWNEKENKFVQLKDKLVTTIENY